MKKPTNKNKTDQYNNATPVSSRRRSRSLNPFATKLSAHVTEEGEWITEPPNLTLSRMFLVVLLLHIVIVGGILAFEMFKEETVAPPPSASVTPLTESRDTIDASSVTPTAGARSYRVQAGDTLSRISELHGVTNSEITAMNRLGSADEIYPGQLLQIPAARGRSRNASLSIPSRSESAEMVPAILAGDAVPRAEIFTPTEGAGAIVTPEEIAPATPSVVAVPPAGAARSHKVEPGETAFAISRRYGVSVSDLLAKNRISDARFLHVGDVLQIP